MKEALLLVLGAALGVLGQWAFYRYQRRDERRQGPELVISRVERNGKVMAELRNIGSDTLTEMDVKLSWLEHQHRRELVVLDFFRNGDGPQRVEVIDRNENVAAAGVPSVSDDGMVDVQVTGLSAKTQHLFSAVSQITVGLLQHG